MNLTEFAASNGDFMGGLTRAQDARDAAQDEYQESLRTNAKNFFYDVENGRHDQIVRVVGDHKLTLVNELLDYIDKEGLFLLIQQALDGRDVSEFAVGLVEKASDKFADATTEWVE